jgi:hypothetical protein
LSDSSVQVFGASAENRRAFSIPHTSEGATLTQKSVAPAPAGESGRKAAGLPVEGLISYRDYFFEEGWVTARFPAPASFLAVKREDPGIRDPHEVRRAGNAAWSFDPR